MTRHALISGQVLIGGVLLMTGSLSAQTRAMIQGTVIEFNTEIPVVTATVELLDTRHRRVARTVTNAEGVFQFDRVAAGTYHLKAGSIGYREVTTPVISVTALEPVHVIVRIAVDAVPLAPLEVVTRPAPVHHNVAIGAFLERSRRKLGGTFFLRDEIEERQPGRVTDLIQLVPGITVIDHGRSTRTGAVHNARAQCQPVVYLDRVLIFQPPRYKGLISAYDAINSVYWGDLEGIEIYTGAASVPAEFSGSRAGCGVVALWTTR